MARIAISWQAGREQSERWTRYFEGEAVVSDLDLLPPEERLEILADSDVLWSWNPGRELNDAELLGLGRLRLLQLISAGADHVPFAKLPPAVTVASNVGAYSEPIAEHALAMALALAKHLVPNHCRLMAGHFNQAAMNGSLRHATVGIIGLGGIGRATADLMRGLGAVIWAINRSGHTDADVDFIGTLADLERVLKGCDVVVLALALTKATRSLIGARELAWMKEDAILINVARAGLIDEAALYQHLRAHPSFQAGIDAWWVEPFASGQFKLSYPYGDLPNLLGSPHNAPMVSGVMPRATERAAENIRRFLRGEALVGVADRQNYL